MELITKTVKLKEVLPEKTVNTYAKHYKIKADKLDYVYKSAVPDIKEIQENERAVIKYVSTISKDRDGDMILPKGIILDDFQKNPIILYAHNHGAIGWLGGGDPVLPIGKDMWIKPDSKGLMAKQVYANHKLADDIYNMHKDGFPLASSIGFIPLKSVRKGESTEDVKVWKETIRAVREEYGLKPKDFDGVNIIFTKVLLLEHSDVPVPSNPDALALAVSKGTLKLTSLDFQKDLGLLKTDMTDPPEFETESEAIIELQKEVREAVDVMIDYTHTLEERIKALEDKPTEKKPEKPKVLTDKDITKMIVDNQKKLNDEINRILGKI